ncbi:MAG: hypothetical protein ACR2PL_16820 [Dehalococcoidia bacterium]
MKIVPARIVWEPGRDTFTLLADEHSRFGFIAEPTNGRFASMLWEVDEQEQVTGAVAGVEILDFMGFSDWEDLPKLPLLWQVSGSEPLPLDELLKRAQGELRSQDPVLART